MASYSYTFTSGDTVTPTKLNAARTVSEIVNADVASAAAIDKTKISGTAITAADSGTVTSAMIADGTIVNADINASAAIAGTKITPNFGSQTVISSSNDGLRLNANFGSLKGYGADATTFVGMVQFNKDADVLLTTEQAIPIIFKTNAVERLRIDGTGGLIFSGGVTGQGLSIVRDGATGGGVINAQNGASGDLSFTTNATERLRIAANGHIGIAKTNPSTILDVNGTVTATAFSGPITGNVTGNLTGTASAVADGAITQAKLAQNVAANGPAFRAECTSTTAVLTDQWTKVNLGGEVFDSNGNFSSSRFTPTVAGYYFFNGSVDAQGGAKLLAAGIYKNGTVRVSTGNQVTDAAATWISNVSALMYLNGTTDYVELFAYHDNGNSRNIGMDVNRTFLEGFLARAA